MSSDGTTRILILGGGFGGLYAAMHLEKTLAREADVEITLMLHGVAASDLDLTHIANSVQKLLRRVKFFAGDVEAIDLPGLQERALTMKPLGDAITLRNRLIALLEEANSECCAAIREPLLTVVVAGGGFAGVETIAAANDFVRHALKFYPNCQEPHLRMVLVHPGPVILPELGEKLGSYAQKKLAGRKVDIRVNTRVTAISERGVGLSDGTIITGNTLVWTAGTFPSPLLDTLACQKERGRLLVNEWLEVPEWPGVWALGDCAVVPDRRTGQAYPPTAQHALREGKILAHNLAAAVKGGQRKPFVFQTVGQLAPIGRRTGVANIMGMNFSGFIPWWLWRTTYLGKRPRFEKKLRVALDWTLDLLFSKDIVQFMTFHAPTISYAETDERSAMRESRTGEAAMR
jgi:NADH:ubiquinone reductase (H+-translocating)